MTLFCSFTKHEKSETFVSMNVSINAKSNEVTEVLLLNIRQLLDIDLKHPIDLSFLRIILCFHHELCCLTVILYFILNFFWWFLTAIKHSTCINRGSCFLKSSVIIEKNDTYSSESFYLTKFFKAKTIITLNCIIIHVIEIFIILLIFKFDNSNGFSQKLFSFFLRFVALLCISFYLMKIRSSKNDQSKYDHQIVFSLHWFFSLLNILINFSKYYIFIGNFTIWKICSSCDWSDISNEFSTVTRSYNFFWFYVNFFYLVLYSIQLVLSLFPDIETRENAEKLKQNEFSPKPNPECTSSFFGRLFFIWFDPLVYSGFFKSLTIEDVFASKTSSKNVETYFQSKLSNLNKNFVRSINQRWLENTSFKLMKILLQQFGLEFICISLIKLVPTLLVFLRSWLLDKIIKFMVIEHNQPQWHGFVYVAAMFMLFFLESILNSFSDYLLLTLALKIRSCLIASIYRRLIQYKLSNLIEEGFTASHIINLMSSDTERVFNYIKIVNLLWICPLQIAIGIYLLWLQLGYGSIAGLFILLLLIPFNGLIGAKLRFLQTRFAKYRDQRLEALNEVLGNIRALKLYAWEFFFQKRIESWRLKEITNLKTQAFYSAAITFAFTTAPLFVALASFSVFIWSSLNSVQLNANQVFVSLSIFDIIRRPLAFFSQLMTNTMMFIVSIKRISDFLILTNFDAKFQLEHQSLEDKLEQKDVKPIICIKNQNFVWPSLNNNQRKFQLKQINLNVSKPTLCAIIGEIGSGKSSLLSAILGQMEIEKKPYTSSCNIKGKIAYVSQNSWIQVGTIRENILFGQEYNSIQYWRVVKTCALVEDFQQMKNGDQTLVGEKGFTLSGGQRQRIAIARAIYADADLYLFDDCLSALDNRIAKNIFNQVISNRGILAQKIRLFVTNNMALLPHMDNIILLRRGFVAAHGNYSELMHEENDFTEFLTTFLSVDSSDKENAQIEDLVVDQDDYEVLIEMANFLEKQFSSFTRRKSNTRRNISFNCEKNNYQNEKKSVKVSKFSKKKIQDNDSLKTNFISLKVYCEYMRAIGLFSLMAVIVCYILAQCFVIASNLWLSSWSDDASTNNSISSKPYQKVIDTFVSKISKNQAPFSQWFRLKVYALLGLGQTFFILTATLWLNLSCLQGSQFIHSSMLNRLMHASIWFFTQSNSGQILSRFNKDIDIADITLVSVFRIFMIEIFRTLSSIVIIIMAMNSLTISWFFIPLIIIYVAIYLYYILASRQLMQLESDLRTPIYQQFNETFSGSSLIQAFNVSEHFLQRIYQRIDMNTSINQMSIAAAKWLSVRLELVGNLVVLVTTLYCVSKKGLITPGNAGLCISYALNLTNTLNMLIRSSTELENNMVAIARLFEYTHLPQEYDGQKKISPMKKTTKKLSFLGEKFPSDSQNKNKTISTTIIQNNWILNGSISFCQYSARYSKNAEFCLKNLNLFIPNGTKVGIVGRTGAGKSSFALALFRLIEPEVGCISISGRNIKEIELKNLRTTLNIIPQEIFLFDGTLRENLDPYRRFTDYQIIEALDKAHLKSLTKFGHCLDEPIKNFFDILSSGQKQLICLARALLKKTKILILDEATASIDPITDELIQKTISLEFADCTLLTIAHRLDSVLNCDKVLVLEQGKIVEFDSPKTLIENKSSIFYKMVSN